MGKSLVQEENWSSPFQSKEVTTKNKNDLLCLKHRGTQWNPSATLLVHVIEGFTIEECNVPFKQEEDDISLDVTTEVSKLVQQENEKKKDEIKNHEIVNASMNSYPEDKDELMSLLPTSCKFCGKPLPEARAMWGKRFCSISCSKKYSVTCTERVKRALHRKTGQQKSPGRGGKVHQIADRFIKPPGRRGRGRGRGGSRSSVSPRSDKQQIMERSHSESFEEEGQSNFDFNFPPRYPLGYGLDTHDIEDELFDGVDVISNYSFIPVVSWSSTEVCNLIRSIPGCESSAQVFFDEEIDGQALLLLKIEHMIHTMRLKLGPSLKIASHIRSIKSDHGIQTKCKYISSPLR